MQTLVLLALLAVLPGAIARSKGRSFLAWWLYGCILLPIAVVHALVAPRRAAVQLEAAPPTVRMQAEIAETMPAKRPKKAGITLAAGEVILGQNLSRQIVIDYADARTNQTRRLILVHKAIGAHGPNGVELVRLYATCSMRKALRTFKVDRIRSAADPETGEVVENLHRHLLA